MNRYISGALAGLALLAVAPAAHAEEPAISIKTNLYAVGGEENAFLMNIGMTQKGSIRIDCGYGETVVSVDPAVFNPETQSIDCTTVKMPVSAAGEVKIYADGAKIDYLDLEGNYITEIKMPTLTNLEILSMPHNELKALDLTAFTRLQSLTLNDNPFSVTPLIVGANKPDLTILSLDIIDNLDQSFNLSDYPALVSFSAWSNRSLNSLDPTGCPLLRQISIDCSNVSHLDVSKNPQLQILNISDTRVRSIDLSHNPNLREFYCQHQSGTINPDIKLDSVDISHNPELVYFYCAGNNLTSLDLSHNPNLIMFSAGHNLLRGIDLSHNPNLFEVNISYNYMDFVTMPLDPGTWNDYICQQHPLEAEYSYPVGGTLDLSGRVIRPGYTTTARVIMQSSTDPNELTLLDESYYTYNNGVINFLKETTDSVYVEFACDAFDKTNLTTTKFMVKNAQDYGKPSVTAQFSGSWGDGQPVELYIGVTGATPANPKKVWVDFGNGTLSEFNITSSAMPAAPNVTGVRNGYSNVTVSVGDGVFLSALGTHSGLYSVNVDRAPDLRDLDLSGCGLYSIELYRNARLERLNLANNNLSAVDLEGNVGAFHKVSLGYINLSNNNLTEFYVPDNRTLIDLDLSGNRITTIALQDADNLRRLNLSGNLLETIDTRYSTQLQDLDLSNNLLSLVTLGEGVCPATLNVAGNRLTLPTLPVPSVVNATSYIFSPQADIAIPTIGPGANLTEQNVTVDGHNTVFSWKKADGTLLTEGVDYTISEGSTRFINTSMGMVYCEMTNGAFPGLVLKTSQIQAAGMPTVKVASFTTPKGNEDVVLSLAAVSGTPAVYFDWTGKGDLEQYQLKDTYTLFPARTYAGANVGVYTYSSDDKISVFSISGATMSGMDASKLNDAISITVGDAGLSSISLPESDKLQELNLDGNNFSELDLSRFTNLRTVSMANNKLTSVDISGFPSLQLADFNGNQLTSFNAENSNLWFLNLGSNQLESIDLSKVPSMEQLGLANNLLKSVDVSSLNGLMALYLEGNDMNFATLPLPKERWLKYSYSNQKPVTPEVINGEKVDLSFNKEASDGNPTQYRWFLGMPGLTPDGIIDGEELYVDDEYEIEDGVTTFLTRFNDVYCVMTNTTFPELYMITTSLNITSVNELYAPEDVKISVNGCDITLTAPDGLEAALYSLNGTLRGSQTVVGGIASFEGLDKGIYILATSAGTWKVLVK